MNKQQSSLTKGNGSKYLEKALQAENITRAKTILKIKTPIVPQ